MHVSARCGYLTVSKSADKWGVVPYLKSFPQDLELMGAEAP